MKVVLGIRSSSWNPAFQLEKQVVLGLESGIPARKADPQPIPPERGP